MNTNSTTITLTADSEAKTDTIAKAFVRHIPGNATIALTGTLGAGKTRFVQGVAVALGATPEQITSPTFVICNQYAVDKHIFHLDAYRIKTDDEFFELGVDEMFLSDGYVFIEWAEKFISMLPRERLSISIDIVSENTRRFHFSGTSKYEAGLEQMRLEFELS